MKNTVAMSKGERRWRRVVLWIILPVLVGLLWGLLVSSDAPSP
ncbi:hypothetical protein [Serratia sp. BIGb0163]|nr:hypothetical protein [Serratia sp. BIGb0163]MCS4269520.1 hypothetical protein [Serratia sp. BIGb0163]